MSGTVHSKIFFINSSNTQANNAFNEFWCIKNYFDTHPGFSRIAWYAGTAGTGNNRSYESGSLGERAYVVYRAISSSAKVSSSLAPDGVPPFDVCFSISYAEVTTTNPREFQSTAGSGLNCIMGWHSSEKAWSASILNNGSDTFTASSTAPFSASSIVFPRINGTSGTDATKRNGCITFDDNTPPDATNGSYLVCTGDNDTIFLGRANSLSAGPKITKYLIIGGYQRITGSYNVPLFMIDNGVKGTDIGSTTTRDGGGIATTSSALVRIGAMENITPSFGIYDGWNIINQITSVTEFPISLYQNEASHYRPAGFLHNIRFCGRTSPNLTIFQSGSGYRLILGTSATTQPSFTLPWASSSLNIITV